MNASLATWDFSPHHLRAESWSLEISTQQYRGAEGGITCCQKGGGVPQPDRRLEQNAVSCKDRIGEVKKYEGAC